jgi:hypothetical protein
VEFFITWAIALGLILVPGLINYYVNRYYSPPGTLMAPTLELIVASLTLTFAVVVAAILTVLLVAQGWDDLRDEIRAFVDMGLVGYGQDRPIATPGALTAASAALMALMALLGALRIPARFVR